MARYASGKKSVALCDRCGQQYPYQDLKEQIENKRPNGLRVCPPCLDKDHPQLQLGRQRIVDPQALRHPRPDRVEPASNIIAFQNRYPHTAGENRFSLSGINMSANFNMTTAGSTSITTPFASFSSAFVQTTAGAVTSAATTYNVFVQTGFTGYGTGNRYFFAGISGPAPTLTLNEGSTYIFDQSDSSNAGHPLRFSTTPNGTHNGGSEYTTGVTVVGTPGNAGAYTQIAVASSAPTLYYYCTNHANMGWEAHTPPGTTENLVITTVANPSGNYNQFHHNQQTFGVSGVDINEGEAYIFDQSDSSNSGHPLRFSTTAGGTHGGGIEYTAGVTVVGTPGSAGAYVRILVASNAPTLYTYCTNHSLMGYRVGTV